VLRFDSFLGNLVTSGRIDVANPKPSVFLYKCITLTGDMTGNMQGGGNGGEIHSNRSLYHHKWTDMFVL
jgi:hypothetical protein